MITFRNQTELISIHVVSDSLIPYPVLLGRDFLSVFNIKLSMYHLIPNAVSKPKIELVADSEVNKICISDQVLHCVYGSVGGQSRVVSTCGRCRPATVACGIRCNSDKLNDSASALSGNSLPHIFNIESDQEHSNGIEINNKLNTLHRETILKIIKTNYFDIENIPEIPHNYEMKLRLNSENPISFPPRRLSYADKLLVDGMVADLLSKGFIRPSNSPYSFPIVMVPKRPTGKRMCVDYRPLNKITIRDKYPLPLIDDCLERMENKKYFSVLDLKNGFHQVRVSQDSVPFTSFVTPNGQYEYVRMPFGLCNAPAVFQRFINFVLRPFINDGSVIVYIDDIALASQTLPEHFQLISKVLRRIAEFRLEINLNKSRFCYEKIDLLGFTISSHGISPNNNHIENIKHLPLPTNTNDVHKCLGLFFIFSAIYSCIY